MKQIERLKAQLEKPETTPDALRFSLHAEELTANEVVICKDLKKSFGTKTLFEGLNMLIYNGEKACLIGENGCGKTTLMKILMGVEQADQGTYKLGPNVNVGYFDQSALHTENCDTVLDDMLNAYPRYDTKQMRNLLGQFLFRGDDVFKRMNLLSGGELARVQLLKMMLRGSNTLFLDEPTNHLDIPSREALESALGEYGGTMLIITHDRYFANKIADRVLLMGKGGLTEFEGDWDSYTQAKAEQEENKSEDILQDGPKNAYQAGKERRAGIARAKSLLAACEKEIGALEQERDALDIKVGDPAFNSDYETAQTVYTEMERVRKTLDDAYIRWEEAQTSLDGLVEEDD